MSQAGSNKTIICKVFLKECNYIGKEVIRHIAEDFR